MRRAHQPLFLVMAALIVGGVAMGAAGCGGGKGSTKGLIAFQTARDDNYEIYVTHPDGLGYTNLTNNAAQDYSPSWSPGGSQIAFASDRGGGVLKVYVMNADGSEQVNLTNNEVLDWSPAWSPDGSEIVFVSDRDGGAEIYVMNADGSEQTRVTHNFADDLVPTWTAAEDGANR